MRALLILLLLVAGTGPLAAQPKPGEARVVIAIFGGLLGKAVRENVEAYTKPLGIQAVFVESASADILAKVRAQKSAPQYDLALLNDQTFVVAKGLGLLAKIDLAEVPNAAALRPGLLTIDGHGAPYEINPIGYVYRRDKLAAAGVPVPDTWRAVLDPRLAGRVITFSFSTFYTPLQMVGLELSAGKTAHDDAEIWAFMRGMKANRTLVVPTPGQAEQLTKSGEAWVYACSAARGLLLQSQGVDVGFAPARDALMSLTNYIAPVRGAPHPVNAQRVLNWIIGPEVQTRLAEQGAVVPVNKDVVLSPELKARMGFDPAQPIPEFRTLDVETLNENFGTWSEQFDKIMSQ